jgi:hypothetical protein
VRRARNFIFAFGLKEMACANPMCADSGFGPCVIPIQRAAKVDPMEAGSRTRIYEILRRSRSLSLGIIRRL